MCVPQGEVETDLGEREEPGVAAGSFICGLAEGNSTECSPNTGTVGGSEELPCSYALACSETKSLVCFQLSWVGVCSGGSRLIASMPCSHSFPSMLVVFELLIPVSFVGVAVGLLGCEVVSDDSEEDTSFSLWDVSEATMGVESGDSPTS